MVSFGTAYSQCGGGHNHSKSSSTKSVDNNDVNAIKDSTKTYTCSMHSEVISDKPGKCPKCGMELILNIDFHGNNNPQFYTFDLQSLA